MSSSTLTRTEALPATAIGAAPAQERSALAKVRATGRLQSIDLLRGLVIVLMALDHVRGYFTGVRFDPLDLSQTDSPLFLTRWITHYCAPVFIFLAGISAYLVSRRCTRMELSRFLLTRGFWLILLEFTVVQFGWTFSLDYPMGLFLQVIWAIGASMILLAALVHLPVWVVGTFGAVLIAGHNLLDGVRPEQFGQWAFLWNLLHVPTEPGGAVFVLYPLIPWVGVMALGFAAGTLYDLDAQRRRRLLVIFGSLAIVAFVLLRLANGYGNPKPWQPQASATFTLLSFIDVHKYPPSLLYVLITLGPAAIALAAFESARGRVADVLITFGRVPLFVYLAHIYLAHLAAGLLALAMGFGTAVLGDMFLNYPQGWGFGLTGVYIAWIFVLAALYPPARWFAELKRRRTDWWLAYL